MGEEIPCWMWADVPFRSKSFLRLTPSSSLCPLWLGQAPDGLFSVSPGSRMRSKQRHLHRMLAPLQAKSSHVPAGLSQAEINISNYFKTWRFWGCLLHSKVDIYASTFQWRFFCVCVYTCTHTYKTMVYFLPDIHCFLVFLSVCVYKRYVYLRTCMGYINIL